MARFLRLLSAKRMTMATRSPPKANMHTTAHVDQQKPCSQPLVVTWGGPRWGEVGWGGGAGLEVRFGV